MLFLKQVGIILHNSGVIHGRIHCTFSRVISVLPVEEGSDLNLNNSYTMFAATGARQGIHEIILKRKII